MFDFVRKAVANIPKLRKPQSQVFTVGNMFPWVLPFMNTYGGKRNVQAQASWNTYYQAMDNVWVDACISAQVMEILAANFNITTGDTDKDEEDHVNYLSDLFNHPNGEGGRETYTRFQWKIWSSLLGTGDAFIEVAMDETLNSFPAGLYYIPPHMMRYDTQTDQYGIIGTNILFEDDELLHPHFPDITNEYWGKSKIDKIASDITADILAWKFNRDYFREGMHPHSVLKYDPSKISNEQFDAEIKRSKESSNNANGTLITYGDFQDLALSNKDMEFGDLMDRVRDRIIAGYGVPPQKVGIIESGNLGSGSGDSQNRDFKKKLKGEIALFEDEFKRVTDGQLGWDESFRYGTLDLDDERAQVEIDDIRLKNGSRYINEIRKRDGLKPLANGGDDAYVVGNLTDVSDLVLQNGNVQSAGQKQLQSLSEMTMTPNELLVSTNKCLNKINAALEFEE